MSLADISRIVPQFLMGELWKYWLLPTSPTTQLCVQDIGRHGSALNMQHPSPIFSIFPSFSFPLQNSDTSGGVLNTQESQETRQHHTDKPSAGFPVSCSCQIWKHKPIAKVTLRRCSIFQQKSVAHHLRSSCKQTIFSLLQRNQCVVLFKVQACFPSCSQHTSSLVVNSFPREQHSLTSFVKCTDLFLSTTLVLFLHTLYTHVRQ